MTTQFKERRFGRVEGRIHGHHVADLRYVEFGEGGPEEWQVTMKMKFPSLAMAKTWVGASVEAGETLLGAPMDGIV